MVKWQLFSGSGSEWDALVANSSDANPFQYYGWGIFKGNYGWQCVRLCGLDDHNMPVAAVQALLKKIPLFGTIAWLPGGPLLGFEHSDDSAAGEVCLSLCELLEKEHSVTYVRFRCHREDSGELSYSLEKYFKRPGAKIDSGYTSLITLNKETSEINAAISSKHRYYVKKALVAITDWRYGAQDALYSDMQSLYSEVMEAKGFSSLPSQSLPALFKAFGTQARVCAGYKNDKAVTACLMIVNAHHACYLLAATGSEGRKLNAAYGMVPELFSKLKTDGVSDFDFCGLAPANPLAQGVDHFKRGFGGKTARYLGEWERATNLAVRLAVNFHVSRGKLG
jgi:lipid II:glycine glycyltransferase (peptidoglycan interpeptide bridge formation enzyme)